MMFLLVYALMLWFFHQPIPGDGRFTEALLAHILVATFAFMILVGTVLSSLMIQLQNNNFGLCKGAGGEKFLMDWMHGYLQKIAGLRSGDPLTFGHLKSHGINLKLNTTCITTGQAVVFPDGLIGTRPLHEVLAFRPGELKDYLPDPVIRAMENAGGKVDGTTDLYHLPDGNHLPVVFATRISLSFPVLFSVVPLYIRDTYAAEPEWIRCWFSDGGITSNMPIHFFDSPLPTRPTFAITLTGFRDDHPHRKPGETASWRNVFVTLKPEHSFVWWTKSRDLFSALSAM